MRLKDYKGFRIYKIIVYEIRDKKDAGIDTKSTLEDAKEEILSLSGHSDKEGE